MTVRILRGDVRDMLKTLPNDSVDCICSSPPYWGLRSYLADDHPDKHLEIGSEPTLAEHLAVLIDVCRELRRILKPAGNFFLNYGDCYATAPNGRSAAATKAAGGDDRTFRDKPFSTVGGVLKPKDLCMIPNRLAIALQEDGWFVRSEIIWGKNNPMPDSSGKFRPSAAHEKIFLLAKDADAGGWWVARDTGEVSAVPDLTERCVMITTGTEGSRWTQLGHYYNAEAVAQGRVTQSDGKAPDGWDTGAGGHGSFHRKGREKGAKIDKQRGHSRRHAGFNERWDRMSREEQTANGRYLRNYEPARVEVWEMATQPFSEAHYATFPPELVERSLRAGFAPGGVVLDPFGGAGTVGLVADRMGIDAILIELNEESIDIAKRRITKDAGMFAEVNAA